MARAKFPAKSLLISVLFAAALPLTQVHAETVGSRAVRSGNGEVTRLIADGARLSPTLARLLARLDATPWLVFVERGKCPAKDAVGCLLHDVGRHQAQPYLRIIVNNRRLDHPHHELSTIAHELQHVLEVAEHATAADIDSANVVAVFRRIGRVSGESRSVTVFETEAARKVAHHVLTELTLSGRVADGKN